MKTALRMSLTAALIAGSAHAQTPAPNPLDAIPHKMPFDVPYGAPISLEQAQTVLNGAMAECKARGWKMSLTVIDSGGNLVAFNRMDGAQLASIVISEHKARAATINRRETKIYEAGIQSGLTYLLSLDGVIGSRGGIPLVLDGKVIGAIGSSGGTGSQDELCAKAGVAALK